MSTKELLFDSTALDQHFTDGYNPPAQFAEELEAAEQRRLNLAELRSFLIKVIGSEPEFYFTTSLATRETTAAEFARRKGQHRSSGTRQIRQQFTDLKEKIENNPELLAAAPPEVLRLIEPE